MIELIDVSKQYAGRPIIRHSNYLLSDHGIYCLNGENGSGKSTILGVIAGAVLPDSGEVHIYGRHRRRSDHSIKNEIAYVPDSCPIYPFITGDEFLALMQSIRNSSALALEHLLDVFRLRDYRRTRFSKMSLGTARKFMLISALMTDAKIFVLDEPTNGLDAKSVEVLQSQLLQVGEDRLVLMACHDIKVRQALEAIVLDVDLFG